MVNDVVVSVSLSANRLRLPFVLWSFTCRNMQIYLLCCICVFKAFKVFSVSDRVCVCGGGAELKRRLKQLPSLNVSWFFNNVRWHHIWRLLPAPALAPVFKPSAVVIVSDSDGCGSSLSPSECGWQGHRGSTALVLFTFIHKMRSVCALMIIFKEFSFYKL